MSPYGVSAIPAPAAGFSGTARTPEGIPDPAKGTVLELPIDQLLHVTGGAGASKSDCDHRHSVYIGTFVNDKNEWYYIYKCEDCGFEYGTKSSGGATGSW